MFNLSTIDSKPSIHVTCVKARLQIIVVIVVIIIVLVLFLVLLDGILFVRRICAENAQAG